MAAKWRNSIKIPDYNSRVHAAIVATCEKVGLAMQDEARTDAPWQDRTANARQGLFYQVEDSNGKWVRIHLAHTMEYGLWLEVANAGRYQIIMPTIEANLSRLRQMLEAIFR